MRDHNERAMDYEMERRDRFSIRYHEALLGMVQAASNEQLGEALADYYGKGDDLVKQLYADPCEFAETCKRILRDYFSDDARRQAEDD
mgnify:CR=1 FL=1